MICKECREAADYNRRRYDFDGNKSPEYREHPKNCECGCQHEMPQKWEKMFRVKPPWVLKVQENEVL